VEACLVHYVFQNPITAQYVMLEEGGVEQGTLYNNRSSSNNNNNNNKLKILVILVAAAAAAEEEEQEDQPSVVRFAVDYVVVEAHLFELVEKVDKECRRLKLWLVLVRKCLRNLVDLMMALSPQTT
jgi:hypothetical protein